MTPPPSCTRDGSAARERVVIDVEAEAEALEDALEASRHTSVDHADHRFAVQPEHAERVGNDVPIGIHSKRVEPRL